MAAKAGIYTLGPIVSVLPSEVTLPLLKSVPKSILKNWWKTSIELTRISAAYEAIAGSALIGYIFANMDSYSQSDSENIPQLIAIGATLVVADAAYRFQSSVKWRRGIAQPRHTGFFPLEGITIPFTQFRASRFSAAHQGEVNSVEDLVASVPTVPYPGTYALAIKPVQNEDGFYDVKAILLCGAYFDKSQGLGRPIRQRTSYIEKGLTEDNAIRKASEIADLVTSNYPHVITVINTPHRIRNN